jgi:hypothetical protein
MTTTTLTPSAASTVRPHSRILPIVRLYFVSPGTIVVVPLAILAAMFVVTLALIAIIARAAEGEADVAQSVARGVQYSGATLYIFVYMMVVAIQGMNFTYPFAMGYGSTRREFYLGSLLTFVLLSLGYALLFTVLAALEEATGGWWLGGNVVNTVYFGEGPWYSIFLPVLAAFLFFFAAGSALGAIYVRFKARGITLTMIALGFLLIGAAALITFTDSWPAFARFFAGLGFQGAYLALAVIAVPIAAAGWLVLRRSTPRS